MPNLEGSSKTALEEGSVIREVYDEDYNKDTQSQDDEERLDISKTTPDSDEGGDVECQEISPSKTMTDNDEGRSLSFWDITAIQLSYSTAGSVVVMPAIFGLWGYVLAPIMIALWMLLMYGIASFVCDVVVASEGRIHHYGDLGQELAGKWGRRGLQFFFWLNFIFYLPVALDTIAVSLQEIAGKPFNDGHGGEEGCTGWWKLITFGILLVLLQIVKSWKESAKISYIMCFLVAIKTFVLIPYGLATSREEYVDSEKNEGPAQPFLNPEASGKQLIQALFPYVFTAVLLVAETMPRTKKPEEYKKSLALSGFIMYFFYLVPGLYSALLWGWNVDFVINTAFETYGLTGLNIALNVLIALPVTLDYIIGSMVVNDGFSRQVFGKVLQGSGWWHNLKCTIPSTLFAFGFVVLVPRLEDVINFQSAIAIVPTIGFAISLAWFFGGKKAESQVWLHLLDCTIGIPVMLAQLLGAIYGMNNAASVGGLSWCA